MQQIETHGLAEGMKVINELFPPPLPETLLQPVGFTSEVVMVRFLSAISKALDLKETSGYGENKYVQVMSIRMQLYNFHVQSNYQHS